MSLNDNQKSLCQVATTELIDMLKQIGFFIQ